MNTKLYVIAFVLLVLAAIVKRIAQNPKVKGKAGEASAARILNSLPEEYKTLNNVIIPQEKGTTQIDHIVISPYGIFVIETKNYSGWIYGAESSENWKQTFKRQKNDFHSPIRQNWGHILALSAYLQLEKSVFKPIVVFSDKATLKVTAKTPVVNMSYLRSVILNERQQILSSTDVDSLYEKISRANLTGAEHEKEHVTAVKNKIAEQQSAIRNGKCPKCGNNLVLRQGKYGQFYGCSNYPKCRFTQKI